MIALLGATGYIGSAFAAEMRKRNIEFKAVSHKDWHVFEYPNICDLVINCAAFIPPTSVAECDKYQAETIRGNMILPMRIAQLCALNATFAHISTGCLWDDGLEHGENHPPQRAFKGHCGFYVGTKVLAEELVREHCPDHYIWRIRLPFDELDCPRNYLSKLARYDEVYDHDNSVTHRGDMAKACLDLWEKRAPVGTYHIVNDGSVQAEEIVRVMKKCGIRKGLPKIVRNKPGACKLSIDKLKACGVKMRSAAEAVAESLNKFHN